MKQPTSVVLSSLVFGLSSLAVAQPEPGPPQAPPEPAPAEPAPPEEAPPLEAPTPAPTLEPEVAAGESDGTESEAGDIVVTGTRIRPKTSFGQAAPVEVVDRKMLQQSGVSNMADSLQFLTVSQGTGAQGGVVGGQGTAAVSAASAINLRGLGVGATLVLINGRRLNPTANGTNGIYFADLSQMPLAAIERIEILKAGAAAIYGADAIGGVVNIITRRNWDGARAEIDAKSTSRRDLGEFTASASFGARSERGRVMAAISYFRRDELRLDERDYQADEKYLNSYGYPSSFFGLASMMTDPANQLKVDPACGTDGSEGSRIMAVPGGEQCISSYGPWMSLLSNAERANAFTSAEYDITQHLTLFAELGVSRYRGDNVVPTFPIVATYPLVPAEHVDNPFGEPVLFIGRPSNKPQILTAADDSFRAVIGLKGDLEGVAEGSLLDSFSWELSASFGISRFRRTVDDNLVDAFQAALLACSDPADLSNCFNPFYSAVDGTGTPNSQAVINRFSGRQADMADHALQIYSAGIGGDLFPLPGGDVGFALGGEIRREWRVDELDHDAHELRYGFLFGNEDFTADRGVYSGYLELRWPFLPGIELQTAARIERYDDTDTTSTSPFAGLTITPVEIIGRDSTSGAFRRLQVRGNVSRAFRAPTIANSYPSLATFPTPLVYQGQNIYIPVQGIGNEELVPETATTVSAGLAWSPIRPLSLNFDVWHYNYRHRIEYDNPQQILYDYEAADPSAPPDPRVILSPTGTPSSVISRALNVDGAVVTNGIDFGVTFGLDGADLGGSETDFGRITLSANGTYTFAYDMPYNQVAPRILPPTMDMPAGTRIDPPDCEGSEPTSACHLAGKRNVNNAAPSLPKLRVNFPLIWTFKGHSAGAIGHYISAYEDDIETNPDGSFDDIGAWFSFDLQYGYTLSNVVGKELAITVGCQNVTDEMPPVVNGNATYYDEEVHDPRGRMFYVKGSAEF